MVKTAVIMAAGLGSCFGQYTDKIPKGLIDFGGISMIERSVRQLIKSGIERIIIGTGYRKEKYEELAQRFQQIECVYSPRYAETNSMYTLFNCQESIRDDDFLLLESDLVFEQKAISVLLESSAPNIMLITPITKFQDQYYVECDTSNKLIKCSTDKLSLRPGGELVGIHKLSNEFYKAMCRDFATKKDEYPQLGYEFEILYLAQNGFDVYVHNEHDLYWYEIDDTEDLAYAITNVLPHL